MTVTLDSSGNEFTITASSTYDWINDPLLCRVKFIVAYNPTYGTVDIINPSTQAVESQGK
jgi:hypothetical protein